ncbi:RCC1 domain-containing protein [Paenibacillus harenae]|uniref:RCC1 domain-containing protein n=1 Tax=Paenibacillus harenae TaxID=306543 RepID=UPI00278D6DAD|nr:fibronectin type III domain-containing protein [Paenibacillus harenae]MDQ0059920.1 alpha-tubulin suppressor-like RCC1 family protein [Paenibacillus harenae]
MRRRFILLVCGFLMLTLLLPFQAAAAEAGSTVEAESSKSGVTMVSAGGSHSLVLRQDGTVWAWGNNYWGALGDGSTTDRYAPVQIKSIKEVDRVAADDSHSLALLNDGTVWEWGITMPSASWDDPTANPTPAQVTDNLGNKFDSAVAISEGSQHHLALKSDGTVWAWGKNYSGQLGDGTSSDDYYTRNIDQVKGLDSVTAISAGAAHNLAINSDGTVWAWGENLFGQLGDGSTTDRHTPVQVQGLDSVTAIFAGTWHSLALKSDGTVWVWGGNDHGQLGDGTTTIHTVPVQLPSITDVVYVAAGYKYSMAVKSDGTVWAWGENRFGQLGDGSTTDRHTPVQVQGLDSVTAIIAGTWHSLALKSDGTVWAWGWNAYGQLGDKTTTNRYTPVQVQGLGETPKAPQWPEGDVLTVTDVTYNSLRLNWQPATDETGVDKYLVYQDNTLLNTLNGDVNSYEVKGLSPNSSYLFSLVAVDADSNHSVKKEVTATTAAYTAPVSFQLSDSKTYSYGGSNYEFLLYYGYISSSGQELSGSWSPPNGFHGVVKVSMISPVGEDYDLSLETVGEGKRLPEDTTLLTDGTKYSAAEVPVGYRAEWRVKGHTDNDYSPDKKVFVYVSIKYDNNH